MSSGRNGLRTVSCAECRRLKLKCDRVFPCSSCRKRGCDALCPNGSLPTRPRAVFRATEQLKNRIYILTDRVRGLEDALQQLQNQVSPDKSHPLLSEELLSISREFDGTGDDKPVKMKKRKSSSEDRSSLEFDDTLEVGEEENVGDIKEALGTLALHSDGRSRFYGATATVESLFQSEFHDNEPVETLEHHLPTVSLSSTLLGPTALWSPEGDATTDDRGHLDSFSPGDDNTFTGDPHITLPTVATSMQEPRCQPQWFAPPLAPDQVVKVISRLEGYLPEQTKAWSLCETYFVHATWLHSCISRKDFLSDIFSPIYTPDIRKGTLTLGSDSESDGSQSHKPVLMERTAILFMAFAIGCLLDLTEPENYPPMVAQAEQYYELASMALGVAGTAERGSISCVQCLMLMSYYHLLLDKPGSSQSSWALIGLNVNIAQCIGLHRDSAWWNNNSEDVQRRRDIFWELFAFERLQSLTLGLPPSLSLLHIDCELPQDLDETMSSTRETKPSFIWGKKHWTRNILSEVLDVLVMASKKPVPYSTILSLDRKLRDDLRMKSEAFFANSGTSLMDAQLTGPIWTSLQAIVNVLTPETTLLLLHRLPLTHALHGPPQNIFGSKYGPSVLASFRSACHIVQLHRKLASLDSTLPFRLWIIWNHLLGAAIVLAALATKNPWCTIAPGALTELDMAYALFKRAASQGAARPTKALRIVRQLRKNAQQAYDTAHKSSPTAAQQRNTGATVGTAPDVDQKLNEDVNILFGSRRIMEIPEQQRSQSAAARPSPSALTMHELPLGSREHASSETPADIFDTVHPELMEDLRSSNQMNEVNYPGLDWSFDGLASWNDVSTDISALDATYEPQEPQGGVVYDQTAAAVPRPFSDPQSQTAAVGVVDLALSAQRVFHTDVVPSVMEGDEAVRDDLGFVAGGVTWDPAWQALMDQLGIAEHQAAMT